MNVRVSIREDSHGAGTVRHGARRLALSCAPLLAIILAACTSTQSADIIAAPTTVEAARAMILPAPGGPTVVSVIEERFSDAVKQTVVLGTDATNAGQNYLEIRLYGPMERETQGRRKLGFKAFSAAGLGAEAFRAVPGVAMKPSSLFLRNSYGPFGYAFGRSAAGDACIYGWQQLRSTENARAAFRNTGAIQVRLRLCESGASEKQLLSVLYGYTINGSFASAQWNPFGPPKDAASTIAGGDPIYPRDDELAAPAENPVKKALRQKPAADLSRNDTEAEDTPADDESAAKAVVDVPVPQDLPSEADGVDGDEQSQVKVPGPGCEDGDLSCN